MTTESKPLGDDLGPIGQGALKAAARSQGIVPASQPGPLSVAFDAQWQQFEEFARSTFEDDLKRARAKAQEYGSHDLEIMGTTLEAMLPQSDHLDAQSRHAAGIEMAIAFYMMGKSARMFGAFKKGTTPGDDSYRDMDIYAMMARYVRLNGKWIG